MRGPQKNRAAGSQEEEESGNRYGHPINFKLTEPFLQVTLGLRRQLLFTEIKANLNYLFKMIVCSVLTLSVDRPGVTNV